MTNLQRYWIGCGDLHGSAAQVAVIPGIAGAQGVIVSGDITTAGGLDVARRVIADVAAANGNIHAQIGNMDDHSVTDWLEAEGMNMHVRARELAPSAGLIGVGCSSPTPFGTPCEASEEQIAAWLDEAYASARDWDALLLVAHDPPFETAADKLPGGMHVGSRAVREFIERVQPDVCLCGHIHEARAVDHLGATTIVNPGMLDNGGYAVITLEDGRFSAEFRILGEESEG
ncbi:metallophosphoesterase family protein [Desulfobaculum sp.]